MRNSTNCYAEAANTIKRTVTALQSGRTSVDDHLNAASWAVPLAAMASPPSQLETHIRNITTNHGSVAGPIAHIRRDFFPERCETNTGNNATRRDQRQYGSNKTLTTTKYNRYFSTLSELTKSNYSKPFFLDWMDAASKYKEHYSN